LDIYWIFIGYLLDIYWIFIGYLLDIYKNKYMILRDLRELNFL